MGPSGMGSSRTDEILEGWKMTSHSAQRPTEPPGADRSRAALPLGLVAASALVILALVVGSRALSSGPGPVLPAVGASPSATAPAVLSTPGPSPSPATQPTPSAQPSAASGSPSPADVAAARDAIDTLTAKLKSGDTTGAWQMLAPQERGKFPSQAQWAVDHYTFFKDMKSYTVIPNPTDVNPIRGWLTGTNGAPIDLAHAVLVEVRYDFGRPATPADWDLFIVAPTADGLGIYDVR